MKRIASLLLTIILCCTAVLPAYAAQQLTQEPELYFVNVLSLVNEESEDAVPFFTVTVYRFPEAGDVLLSEEETLYEMIGDSVYYEGGIDTEAPFEYQGIRLYDVAEIMKKTRTIGKFDRNQQLLILQKAASLDDLKEQIEKLLRDTQVNLSYYNES